MAFSVTKNEHYLHNWNIFQRVREFSPNLLTLENVWCRFAYHNCWTIEMCLYTVQLVSFFSPLRIWSAGEMLSWTLHPPLHWFPLVWRKTNHGVPMQFKRNIWKRALLELPKESLQQFRVWSQKSGKQEEPQNVSKDPCTRTL